MIGVAVFALLSFALFYYVWKTPAVVIGGILCLYGLDQWGASTHIFFVQHQSFCNIIFGVAVLLAHARLMVKTKNFVVDYSKIGMYVLAMKFYAFTSIMWSPDISVGIALWMAVLPYTITFMFLAPLIMRRLSDIHEAISFLILFGGVIIIMTLFFTEWSGRGIIIVGQLNKYGKAASSNPLAIAGMAGYIAIACIFGRQWNENWIWNKLKWVLACLCMVLIIKSGSRGQLLFLLATVLFYWPLGYKIKSMKGFVLIVLMAIATGFLVEWGLKEYWGDVDRWDSDKMSSDAGHRMDVAENLLNYWWRDGLLTIIFGLGSTASFDVNITVFGFYPHIVILEVLGEEGVIGIVFFISIIFMIAKNVLRSLHYTDGYTKVRGSLIVLCAMATFDFLLTFKQGSFLGNTTLPMFYILIGKYCETVEKQVKVARQRNQLSRSQVIL